MAYRRRGPIRECLRCHRNRHHMAKGLCDSCYKNSTRVYAPAGDNHRPRTQAEVASRVEEFALLVGYGYTVRDASARMGINERTGHRYAARLRQLQAA